MKFKESVKVDGVTKECILGMAAADRVISLMYNREMVVTSVADGIHRNGSKHYEGNAFDIRTWTNSVSGVQMTNGAKNLLRYCLEAALGDDWDVVTEATHIHCEYDP